jgi:hypothetical protein
MKFTEGACSRFPGQSAGKRALSEWPNTATGDCQQSAEEHPKLRLTAGQNSYLQSIRMGGSAVTRKRETSIYAVPLSSSEHEAAVAAFIRNRGVTRCPTACLARTQASVSAADRVALEQYETGREQSRRSHIAATARALGLNVPELSVC